MGRRPTPVQPEPAREPTPAEARQHIGRLTQRIADWRAIRTDTADHQWAAETDALITRTNHVLAQAFGESSTLYRNFQLRAPISTEAYRAMPDFPGGGRRPDPQPGRVAGVEQTVINLQAAIDILSDFVGAPVASGAAVPLNQSDTVVQNIHEMLETILKELRAIKNNSPEHARREAEAMAAIQLMRGPEVRPDVVNSLLIALLKDLALEFKSTAIGMMATTLLTALGAYFGFTL